MKQTVYLFTVLASLVLLPACRKNGPDHRRNPAVENKAVSVNVSVTTGSVYTLSLSQYGRESAVILQQAAGNYTQSEIVEDAGGNFLYRYSGSGSPKAGEPATDEVTLKVTDTKERQRDGCQSNNQVIVHTTINVKITIQ